MQRKRSKEITYT